MKSKIRKIAAGILAALTLTGVWFLYRGDFLSLRTDADKVEAIRQYASDDKEDPWSTSLRAKLHPVIEFDEIVGGYRILIFSDSEIDGLIGEIKFRRGILGGWQPLGAFYSAGRPIQGFRVRDEDFVVVYGVDVPAEISSYLMAPKNPPLEETIMAQGTVTDENFFHVYETDRNFFPALYYFNKDGNELDGYSTDQSIPHVSIGSAEINMIYFWCGLFLLIGFLIARSLWLPPIADKGENPVKKDETK